MKEQCQKCQHLRICVRREITTKLRQELKKLEEKYLYEGASGRIVFHCDCFREKELKE